MSNMLIGDDTRLEMEHRLSMEPARSH